MPAEPPETSPDAGRVTPPRAYANISRVLCWPCMFDAHFEPNQWHTWADDEDIEHAKATGHPDPTKSRCSCSCAEVI